jgi:DNA-binding transcriptional LysR family regulator
MDASTSPEGITRIKVWRERLAVALPTRHPLLSYDKVPVHELQHFPLIAWHPEKCAGNYSNTHRWLSGKRNARTVNIAEYVSGHEQMILLVAAGYGVAVGMESQFSVFNYPHVVIRQVDDDVEETCTFMVMLQKHPKGDRGIA